MLTGCMQLVAPADIEETAFIMKHCFISVGEIKAMWRAFVMAIGLSLVVLGAEFMVVDRLVMASPPSGQVDSAYLDRQFGGSASYAVNIDGLGTRKRVFVPPEWAPWGLLSAGVLTVLYGAALPRSG